MLRTALTMSALALAACSPTVPDSAAGVGFGDYADYSSYRATRENELRAETPVTTATVSPTHVSSEAPITTQTLSAAGIGPRSAPSAPATYAAASADPGPGRLVAVPENDATISDEQNFAAVADRQTIESDAERLRAQRQAYQVIQPTALPARTGAEGPNIVQYALSTRNAVGQQAYSRSALSGSGRAQRACAGYASSDLAQEAFLASGGPERDKLGLDPDGDGFACGWDPTPFRRAASARG